MSTARLYCSDQGRMLRVRNEELSRFVLASKTFRLEEGQDSSAALFIFVREYPGNRGPLHLEVNGREVAALDPWPEKQGSWEWAELPVPEGALSSGDNQFVLRAESNGMSSWSIGVSCENSSRSSRRSADGGRSWPSGMMLGYDCTLSGEYMMRLLVDPAVKPDKSCHPKFVYENREHPLLQELHGEFKLEKLCRGSGGSLEKARRIMSWWTASWTYSAARGISYAPWEPFTVIDWKKADWGAGFEGPIAFCVHGASCLSLLLRSVGLFARCVVTNSEDPQGTGGHFLTELWEEEQGRWVILDPHFDAVLTLDGRPASALELQGASEVGDCARMGFEPGESYGANPRCKEQWLERWLAGRGVWELGYLERGDIASHPELCPVEHGAVAYHQSSFLWLDTEKTPHRPYFPRWTTDRRKLQAPPQG